MKWVKDNSYKPREMSDSAKASVNAYNRAWRKEHPEKNAEYRKRYWEKKALRERQEKDNANDAKSNE